MVDSMKQSFLLKPEVLTPNRNGFMAKKRKWHLKAGSTVQNCVLLSRFMSTSKVGFLVCTSSFFGAPNRFKVRNTLFTVYSIAIFSLECLIRCLCNPCAWQQMQSWSRVEKEL